MANDSAEPPTSERVLALRPLRHACHACGTCCQGWKVWIDPDERPEIDRVAAALGVDRPYEDLLLRMVGGRCVFLDDANLCRIHGAYGAAAKPRVCQTFPRRAVRTEEGLRVGIDPGCTSTARSWRDGPEVTPPRGAQEERILSEDLALSERALIGLALSPDMTIARLVGVMVGAPDATPELPHGFAVRLTARLMAHDLGPYVAYADHGPALTGRIAPVAAFLRTLDPLRPPRWAGALTPADESFALEALRRHLFLRLGDATLPPVAQALLVLAGIAACAWSARDRGDPSAFAGALSVWLRMMRARSFWSALVPDTTTAKWILAG